MSDFRPLHPPGSCTLGQLENPTFRVALTEHTLNNIKALADSMLAAFSNAREANNHLLASATEDLSQRVAAATAWATAPASGELIAVQREFADRALERYAADARVLWMTLLAGALAIREPLLERLR